MNPPSSCARAASRAAFHAAIDKCVLDAIAAKVALPFRLALELLVPRLQDLVVARRDDDWLLAAKLGRQILSLQDAREPGSQVLDDVARRELVRPAAHQNPCRMPVPGLEPSPVAGSKASSRSSGCRCAPFARRMSRASGGSSSGAAGIVGNRRGPPRPKASSAWVRKSSHAPLRIASRLAVSGSLKPTHMRSPHEPCSTSPDMGTYSIRGVHMPGV